MEILSQMYVGLHVKYPLFLSDFYLADENEFLFRWTVRGSNPDGDEIFRTRPDRPWGLPSPLYNGCRLGVALTTHLLLAPRLKEE